MVLTRDFLKHLVEKPIVTHRDKLLSYINLRLVTRDFLFTGGSKPACYPIIPQIRLDFEAISVSRASSSTEMTLVPPSQGQAPAICGFQPSFGPDRERKNKWDFQLRASRDPLAAEL
jgi:hypothetical protein